MLLHFDALPSILIFSDSPLNPLYPFSFVYFVIVQRLYSAIVLFTISLYFSCNSCNSPSADLPSFATARINTSYLALYDNYEINICILNEIRSMFISRIFIIIPGVVFGFFKISKSKRSLIQLCNLK